VTVTCWAPTAAAEAAGPAATGGDAVAATGAGVGVGEAAPGTSALAVGACAGAGTEGVATRAAEAGPNIDGWPLCRFHASQMKKSEARKMPQSRVRRMSVMAAFRRARAFRIVARARARR